MHRLKMRPMLLIAGLIGLLAIVFGLINTTNSAQATTPDGAWKLIGQIIKVKSDAAPTVSHVTIAASPKTAALTEGANVIIVSNPPKSAQDYPHSWTVVAYKAPDLWLQIVPPGQCTLPAGPTINLPAPGTQNLYAGPCPKPAVPTPGGPPDNAADLSGVADLVVDNGMPATVDLYHCMVRTDVADSGDAKSAAVCFDNTGALGTGTAAEPLNSAPGEGSTGSSNKAKDCGFVNVVGGGGPLSCLGPPPPPPYSVAPPAKGRGTYVGGATDSLVVTSCFPDVGPSVNIIAKLTIDGTTDAAHLGQGAHAQLANNGKQVGSVEIYAGQTNLQCDTLAPTGVHLTYATSVYPSTNRAPCPLGICQHATSWRTSPLTGGSATDWDGDGCTDSNELWQDKPGSATKCGDDPWNPNDVTASTDVSGSYDLTAIATRQDVGAPGFYYDCKADIQQAGKALTARVLCYIDSPLFTVNPQAALPNSGPANTFPKTCGVAPLQAPAKYCGDGISGAPPPGTIGGTYPTNPRLFADVDDKQTVLTGTLDNAQNVMKLSGCFEDRDGFGGLGNVYVDAIINAHTGHGQVNLQVGILPASNCTQPGGPGGASTVIPLHIVRQAPGPRAKAGAQALVLAPPTDAPTCDANPVAGTRHYTTVLPHQMIFGGTVEITGVNPIGFNGRYPVAVDSPTKFHTVPKDEKAANPPCPTPLVATAVGTYVVVRDSDGDNCPDKKELGDVAASGGLRDPYNPYDYFNPTADKQNRVDDILKVVHEFFHDDPPGVPDMKSNTDRTGIPGGNAWNLGPPNGQQRVDDILAAVKQFFHDC